MFSYDSKALNCHSFLHNPIDLLLKWHLFEFGVACVARVCFRVVMPTQPLLLTHYQRLKYGLTIKYDTAPRTTTATRRSSPPTGAAARTGNPTPASSRQHSMVRHSTRCLIKFKVSVKRIHLEPPRLIPSHPSLCGYPKCRA